MAKELCRADLDQILVDGFFQADPHLGNVFITEDGRLALLDLGIVSLIDLQKQESLFKLLLAMSDGRGQEAARSPCRSARRSKRWSTRSASAGTRLISWAPTRG